MTEHIINMVRVGNPEAIEKYVKNHLPNDQPSLERIYKELLQYESDSQSSRKMNDQKRSQSFKAFNKRSSISSRSNASKQQSSSELKRTENMIRILKQKGLKIDNASEQKGMEMYSNQRSRLVKPLITNSKLLKSEQAQIDRLIHRYTINGGYYKQLLSKDTQKDAIDPQMQQFFERRKSILDSLRNKANQDKHINQKYDHVPKRLYEPQSRRMSYEQIPMMKQSKMTTTRKTSSQNLLSICDTEVKSEKFKTIKPSMNYFQTLQDRLESIDKDEEGEIAYNQMAALMVQQVSSEQYERYTNSYMSMLTDKVKAGSKCKLNGYQKDLIQDEKKMRKIIDFHSK